MQDKYKKLIFYMAILGFKKQHLYLIIFLIMNLNFFR